MSLKQDRTQVQWAARNLLAQRRQLHRQTQWLADAFERLRPSLIVGGGLFVGLLLGRGKLTDATRTVAAITGLGMTMMRSSLGTILLSRTFRASVDTGPQANNRQARQSGSKLSTKI